MTALEQIIVKGVRIKGNLKLTDASRRILRMSCGRTIFKSKPTGMTDQYSIEFEEVGMHIPRQQFQEELCVEIAQRHEFGSLKEYELQLHGSLPLSSILPFRGEYLEMDVLDIHNQKVGLAVLVIDLFQKHRGFSEKITEASAQKPRRSASPTNSGSNQIKHILTQNLLSNRLMTINSVVMHNNFDDAEIQGTEVFLMVRYGKLKHFTRPVKKFKEEPLWVDYLEFLIDENLRYEFFLLYINDVKDVVCRAKGEIKYIVFDKTITAHTVVLNDRVRQPYGTLHIKFAELASADARGSSKPDRKVKDVQDKIPAAIDEFNKVCFDGKYQGHLLSPNLRDQQLRKLQQEQNQKPLNPQEVLIREQNKRFVEFLQRQLIKFDRQMQKQQKSVKKKVYLPLLAPSTNSARTTHNSNRTDELHQSSVMTLPKI